MNREGRLFFGFVCLLISAASGCRNFETRFHILSFADPSGPEPYSDRFPEGVFAVDAQGNWDIVFVKEESLTKAVSADQSEPADGDVSRGSGESPGARGAGGEMTRVRQMIHFRVFWRLRPGTTYAEKTQTNATIIYFLEEGSDAIAYEGAGLVSFPPDRECDEIRGELESSGLSPTRTTGQPTDYFGNCRLTGPFAARLDKRAVIERLQELRRRLGSPSPRTQSALNSEGT